MALTRAARLLAAGDAGGRARWLRLEFTEPLGFVGGQYLVVDPGLTLPNGKRLKRAYSIVSADREQRVVELVVQRLPDGPGSSFMHALEVGAEVRFSGPWGKMHPAPDSTGAALLLATDTGVTALVGLAQSARFRPLLASACFVWLRPLPDEFWSEAGVRAALPAELGEVCFGELPAPGHPERLPLVRARLERLLATRSPKHAFLAGDGAVNYALLSELTARGVDASRDRLESFFNLPKPT